MIPNHKIPVSQNPEWPEMSIALELKHTGDGRMFLNYWDTLHGNDVCAEIRPDGLYLCDEFPPALWQRIDLDFFITRVNEAVTL